MVKRISYQREVVDYQTGEVASKITEYKFCNSKEKFFMINPNIIFQRGTKSLIEKRDKYESFKYKNLT
jgi:hypothetical protein